MPYSVGRRIEDRGNLVQDPRKPWDGKRYKSRWQRFKDSRREANEEWERKRQDPEYIAKQKAKKAKKERKRKKDRLKRSVFDEVTKKNEDGERECIRCGETDFKTRPKIEGNVGTAIAGVALLGPLAAVVGVSDLHKICKKCGAAYPLS